MRGLEVILFMLCCVLAVPLIPILAPGLNSGIGIDTGVGNFTGTAAFDWDSIEAPPEASSNPIIAFAQQAEYYFSLALTALGWIASLLFSALWVAPELLGMFSVNPVLTGILLSLLGIILLLSWMQIAKGDDWSGRR